MYAEAGLMYPHFQSFPQGVQQFEEFYCSQKPNASSSGAVSSIAIPEYGLWGEGDLFQAPKVVVEEPVMGLDPMMAAISMISCGEDVISPQSLAISDIESSIESGQILSEMFYECRKDLLAKEGNATPIPVVIGINNQTADTDENLMANENLLAESPFPESTSSGCLKSEDTNEALPSPNFLDSQALDFGAVYGMRRAFSEGDIKDRAGPFINSEFLRQTLGNGNGSFIQPQMEQSKVMSSIFTSEDRRKKLSRYRSKKSRRNFDRKIKYACRKALADSQPRIRGRFAKTEETESSKKHEGLLLKNI